MKAVLSSVRWRNDGPFTALNASKTGLLAETRLFLLAYDELGDPVAAGQALIAGALPQRSRETRVTIVRIILERLARWDPPAWIWTDMVAFARDDDPESLRAALLLHVSRQDPLLYKLIQQVIVPSWRSGELLVVRADVQRLLDRCEATHPEIRGWNHETREKLAGNLLTILRDYGLLQGSASKRVVEPVVPAAVVDHLVRLLRAEGVPEQELAQHPDWLLWLWDESRARAALADLAPVGASL